MQVDGDSSQIQVKRDRTIRDFGDQWSRYVDNEGYYASLALFSDIVEPLISVKDFEGARVADIGSGTGRIVAMAVNAGASDVLAVEPSEAFFVLEKNVAEFGDRVRCMRARGDELPAEDYDIVTSIGVLHHIPDPVPVVKAAYRALRPGGKLLIWLYGKEGNGLYLGFAQPVRAITKKLPVPVNAGLAWVLDLALAPYIALCKRFSFLPMADYMKEVLGRFDAKTRRLTIVDQLNPAWAKYYTRHEAVDLLGGAGFDNVQSYRRHGYSWTVVGTKPTA